MPPGGEEALDALRPIIHDETDGPTVDEAVAVLEDAEGVDRPTDVLHELLDRGYLYEVGGTLRVT